MEVSSCAVLMKFPYFPFEMTFFLIVFFDEQPAHEKIGVVDAQWIVHQTVPSLGSQVYQLSDSVGPYGTSMKVCYNNYLLFLFLQGKAEKGKAPWEGVC